MKKYQHFLISSILGLIEIYASAQVSSQRQFRFINFSSSQGLTSPYVYCATQDTSGQIWVGTGFGLYRFDNRYFSKVEPNKQQTGRDINSILQALYFDNKTGKIWCGSLNHFLLFDPKTQKFETPALDKPFLDEIADAQIQDFYRDSKGRMWIATGTHSWAFFNEKDRRLTYFHPKNDSLAFVFKIVESSDGILWASTSKGLQQFDPISGEIITYIPEEKGILNSYFGDIYFDSKYNAMWLCTPGVGLYKFDISTKKFTHYAIPHKKNNKVINTGIYHTISPLSETELLLDMVEIFDKKTGEISNISSGTVNEYVNRNEFTQNSFRDKEGNLWLCTHNGLSLLEWQNQHIVHHTILDPKSHSHGEITNFQQLSNEEYLIELQQANSLMYYSSKTGKTLAFFTKNKANVMVNTILKIPDNKYILATTDGIYLLHYPTLVLTKIKWPIETKYETKINTLFIDRDGHIYASVNSVGLFVLKKNSNVSFQLIIDYNNPNRKFKLAYLVPSCQDKSGIIWCTSSFGLVRFSPSDYKYELFQSLKNGIDLKNINKLVLDKNDHLWFSTTTNGLFELWVKGARVYCQKVNLHHSNMLNTNFTNGLCFDKDGFLWAVYLGGLLKIDTKTKNIIQKLHIQQGLNPTSFSRDVYCSYASNLYCISYSGIDVVNTDNIKTNKAIGQCIFSNVVLGSNNFSNFPTSNFNLDYNEGSFSLNVGNNLYNNGNLNQVYYTLSPIEPKWNALGANYTLIYSGLKPGEYKLKFKILNNNRFASPIQSYQFRIKPPFYKTIWFLSSLIALIAGFLYFLYTERLKTVRKEVKLQAEFRQKIAETEMKALRAQMNPHFMFNALNSIQKYVLTQESKLASEYLTKFSRLIRLILDQSQQSLISLSDEIALLNHYVDLEKMRFNKAFDFSIQMAPEINIIETKIPAMLLQPYIENAIWHGILHKPDVGKLEIIFSKLNADKIQIVISDNGIGREKSAELKSKSSLKHKSYGMSIATERINLFNQSENDGKIEVIDLKEDGIATGTRVILTLTTNQHIPDDTSNNHR